MLSSRPQATVLGNGALLVTAGRPGLDVWISTDGFGHSWEMYSIPTIHNGLVASENKPKQWGYVRTNYYYTMSCTHASTFMHACLFAVTYNCPAIALTLSGVTTCMTA